MARAATLKELARQKARILSIASAVEKWMGLDWLDLKHLFNENEHGDDVLAQTVAKWQYRYAEITWNLYNVMMVEDETLYGTMIHEYIHVLLAPLDEHLPLTKPHVTKQNEFAVESVAQALLHALRTPPPKALG